MKTDFTNSLKNGAKGLALAGGVLLASQAHALPSANGCEFVTAENSNALVVKGDCNLTERGATSVRTDPCTGEKTVSDR